MKALITGASSGLGATFAKILSDKGHDLILVARRKKKMETLAKQLKTNVKIIELDISSTYNCMLLYEKENIMGRLFGTDGVRGVANSELTPELAFKLGIFL